MRTILLAVVVPLVVQAHALAADPAADWRGVKVLPKLDVVVKVGNETIDYVKEGAAFRLPWIVQDVKGEWLWIGDYKKGWVQRSKVVTFDEAPAYYTQVINSGKQKAWAYSGRAAVSREKGDLDLAIADLGEALRLEPDASTYSNRAVVLFYKKEYDRAIADCDEAIRLNPKLVAAYEGRGCARLAKKDYQEAIVDFDQAVQLDPGNTSAYYNLACCYALQNKIDLAIEKLSQSLKLGYSQMDFVKNDPDFDSIRSDPRYRELVQQYSK